MNAKRKKSGRTCLSSDQPPEITDRWIAEADLYKGKKLVKRGRPKLENPKQLLSIRVRSHVIAAWKASGAGWQTRMALALERTMPKTKRPVG